MHCCVCFWEHQFDAVCTGIGCLSTCAFKINLCVIYSLSFFAFLERIVTNHWTESKTVPEYDHFASGAIVYVRFYPSGVDHLEDQTLCGRLLLHMSGDFTPRIVPAFRVVEEVTGTNFAHTTCFGVQCGDQSCEDLHTWGCARCLPCREVKTAHHEKESGTMIGPQGVHRNSTRHICSARSVHGQC